MEPTGEQPQAKAYTTPCVWVFVHGRSNSVPYLTGDLGHRERRKGYNKTYVLLSMFVYMMKKKHLGCQVRGPGLLSLVKVSRARCSCSAAAYWCPSPSLQRCCSWLLGRPCPSQQDQTPILNLPIVADFSSTALVTADRHFLLICNHQFTSVLCQTEGQLHRGRRPHVILPPVLSSIHEASGSADTCSDV